MRNLRDIQHTALKYADDDTPLTATAWDGTSLICAFGPTTANPAITLKRLAQNVSTLTETVTIASWDAPSPNPDLAYDKILHLYCFPDSGSICLVLEGGDIILVREDPQPGEDLIEIVGSVDAGISAAAWSPDEELLLIASKAETLLFMTREFEGTATLALSVDDLKVSDHVSVGWGKRETQFQGRGAKALRDPTVPEHVDSGKLNSMDDLRTMISWRGDGQYVAINSILETEPRRRVIRVVSREGVLDSVSEPVDHLEGALSWKPSGQLIAGIQRRDSDGVDVVFFERNGLRHGEFSLRLTTEQGISTAGSIDLAWNNDSSILAVSMRDRVQLWTMGNYHYYLKQEILLHASDGNITSVWHTEKALRLACYNEKGLHALSYSLEVSSGSVVPPHDEGIVAVIDGSTLKITPLRHANVPPPMALDEIQLPSSAIDVAINKTGKKIAVLHHDEVTVWEVDYSRKPFRPATLGAHYPGKPGKADEEAISRQIVFGAQDEIITLSSGTNTNRNQLKTASDDRELHHENKNIITLPPCSTHERVFFETSDGVIMSLNEASPTEGTHPISCGKLPSACPSTQIWSHEDSTILFGLTSNGVLHIQRTEEEQEGQKLKVQGCTSFFVTDTHLAYTTSQHLLKFVHLHPGGDLEIPPDEPEKDERCRNIERGAKLVTVVPSVYSLVLQMPRGNLETIYPRALVLAGIRRAINNRDYKKAFLICRTHRVDMNIIHDYVPDQFMRDIDLFVKQLKKVEFIDLFLSSLSDEDVSVTIYKETAKALDHNNTDGHQDNPSPKASTLPTTTQSKTNRICNAFLEALTGREPTNLQNIVSAHVCKNPPDLEAGLSLVAQLRAQENQDQLEQAVEHICFLADVNRLYDTALGIYDLDVALLVAQQSQKDPREYLPYLQRLHDMPVVRRKHAIDDDLKRYERALSHLFSTGTFEEIKKYVLKHDLYEAAVGLYRYDAARLAEVMRLHAEFLGGRNRYRESGIAFEFVGDFTAAHEAYRSCSMWRECLACAGLMGMSADRISELALDLASSLEESKDYVAAATVYSEYLHDLPSSVRMLCRGYQFADAIRQVAMQRDQQKPLQDLLKSLVDPALVEMSASTTEMLAEMRTQLQAQVPRLRELRQKKAEDPMGFLDGGVGADGDGDVPDNVSLAPTDTTTAGTFMTRYTNRSSGTLATNATRKTSKNRRREERKRARGKKGTVYEEEYLVNSIARLFERLNAIGEDKVRLVESLMRRVMRERAVAVENAYREAFDACEACGEEVFGSSGPTAVTSATSATWEGTGDGVGNGEVGRPFGGQGVLWDALTAQRPVAPVLVRR